MWVWKTFLGGVRPNSDTYPWGEVFVCLGLPGCSLSWGSLLRSPASQVLPAWHLFISGRTLGIPEPCKAARNRRYMQLACTRNLACPRGTDLLRQFSSTLIHRPSKSVSHLSIPFVLMLWASKETSWRNIRHLVAPLQLQKFEREGTCAGCAAPRKKNNMQSPRRGFPEPR